MERISRLFIFYKEYFVLLTTVVLSTFLLFSNNNNQISRLEEVLIDLVGSVQQQLVWSNQIFTALQKNRTLRRNNVELALENSLLRKAYQENQRLREELGFKQGQSHQIMSAMVVNHGLYQFTKVIQIDVGADEGVKKNMSVISHEGLVGKLLLVGSHYSIVQVMGDVNFSVSAKINRTRATGIVTWESGSAWLMENIVKSFEVITGDSIATSGMSGIYPPDILIGVVTQVSDNEPGMFKKILVKPFVDFSRLEEVFVILDPLKSEFQIQPESQLSK